MTNQGDGVGEGGQPFGIPGGRAQRKSLVSLQQMRCQGHPGEKTEEDWRGPGDGPVRPLALGFDSQVSAYFLEGHFQLPAQHKPLVSTQ